MNTIEFGSKTLLFYSLKKNERVDLSCLPDEVFDKVIHGLWQTKICQEGSTSEAIFKVGMCLPAGPYVSDDDVRYIVETIKPAIIK